MVGIPGPRNHGVGQGSRHHGRGAAAADNGPQCQGSAVSSLVGLVVHPAVGAYRYRGPGGCRHSRGLASATLALASADVYAAAAVIINAANCANTYNLASGGASRVARIG